MDFIISFSYMYIIYVEHLPLFPSLISFHAQYLKCNFIPFPCKSLFYFCVCVCVCVSMNIVVALYRKVTIFYRNVGTLLKIIPLRKMYLLHEEALRINWLLAIEDQVTHTKSMLCLLPQLFTSFLPLLPQCFLSLREAGICVPLMV